MKKNILKITSELVWWAVLVGLLSLGQLQRWQLGPSLAVYGHDIVIVAWWIWSLVKYPQVRAQCWKNLQQALEVGKRPQVRWWLAWLVLSWAAAALLTSPLALAFAWFRLARLIAYASSGYLLWLHWRAKHLSASQVWLGILGVIFFLAWFGWWQFWLLPDTRFLRILGWDDHFYRLIGTWLDPAFTGLGLVLGVIYLHLYLVKNHWQNKSTALAINATILFLAGCVAITYSRSSYLSLGAWAVVWLWVGRKQQGLRRWVPLLCLVVLGILIQFPSRVPTESTNLTRTYSTVARFENTAKSWRPSSITSLVLGDGLLVSSRPYVSPEEAQSKVVATDHPQFPDNILVSFWRQLGVLGVMMTGWLLIPIWRHLFRQPAYWPWLAALLIHSLFNHSLIQPFIWLFTCWGVTYFAFISKEKKISSKTTA